ncbi:cell division protein MraZ [Mycoplasmopsis californica]|uniref:Transcriptional regulator MraZ n=1 Tax=Mycoplasmopsis californica TaxID=2113 RepID=A0A059XLW9_9BACT|nr:division/cell wall cluster transcriptional repressor MraZ [Mycoplasmopsis californica]AIA29529.1 cell division protein MraZ [Mycoplasmopsis californica]
MYGQFERTIDAKNRVALPAKLRDALGSKFYLTISMNNVIELRDEAEFNSMTANLNAQSIYDANARMLKRYILGNTHEIELDAQARFIIPKPALAKGEIQKDVIFIGVGNFVELWGAETFKNYEQSISDEDIALAARALADKER